MEPKKLTDLHLKVLGWFFAFPSKKINLSYLASELNISKKTASNVVKELSELQFLIKEEVGPSWQIMANTIHPTFQKLKIAHNLYLISSSDILDQLKQKFPSSRSMTLFGSFRKGTDLEKSDVNIAVESSENFDSRIIPLGQLPELGYRKNVPLNIHLFSRIKIDQAFLTTLANGIVLDGFLETRI